MTVAEILRQALIAVGGIAVGWGLGRWERATQAGTPARKRWWEIAKTLFGLVVVGMVVATYLQAQGQVDCYRGFFSEVADSIRARSESAGQTTTAQRKLAQASLVNDETVRRRALVEYVAALDETERVRHAEPLPEVPSC